MIYQQINNQENNLEQQHPLYGNNIVICNPQCMLGPHYYVFIPTFIIVSIFFSFLFLNVRELLSTIWSGTIFIAIAICMISYLLVGFSNPGIVITKVAHDTGNRINLNVCIQCGVIKDRGVRHCKDCNCCIQDHDHHCPWVGKCVGSQNKGRFYFFLFMMFVTLILFFIGTISSSGTKSASKL